MESKTISVSFLDGVMVYSIHVVFFLGIRNPLHHNEGTEPHVGSQERSLATKADNTRAGISD